MYLIQRRVENVFVIRHNGKFIRVAENLVFDFTENKYVLTNLSFEDLGQIKGGGKNG